MLYERYLCLREAMEHAPGFETLLLSQKSYVTPYDYRDFHFLNLMDGYNLQIYSQLLREMGWKLPAREFEISRPPEVHSSAGLAWWKFSLKRMGSKILEQAGKDRPALLCDMPFGFRDLWKLCRTTGFSAWPMLFLREEEKYWENELQPDLRLSLKEVFRSEKDVFPALLASALPVNFPWLYLEGYARMCDAVAHLREDSRRKVLISSMGWKSNERFKFLAAGAAERGVHLVGVQHGGVTGLSDYSPAETLAVDVVNSFVTWGAYEDKGDKETPMPDPKVQRLYELGRRARNDVEGELLFVANSFPKYASRGLRTQPIASQVPGYLKWSHLFFQALPGELRSQFCYRPYPVDYGWGAADSFHREFPEVRVDDFSESILGRLEHSRLAVIDNPQTTFIEALILNRPFILFYDPDMWLMRSVIEERLEPLRQVGILHHDPGDAAKFVEQVEGAPHVWWSGPAVQEAREAFLAWYAPEGSVWLENWKSVFRLWLEKGGAGAHAEDWEIASTSEGAALSGNKREGSA